MAQATSTAPSRLDLTSLQGTQVGFTRRQGRTQTAVRSPVRPGASATDTNAMRSTFHSSSVCEST